MLFHLHLSDVFLGIRLGLWVCRKNATGMECTSHHIISRDTQHQHVLIISTAYLSHLLMVVFASFLQCNVTIYPFPSFSVWKQVPKSNPHSGSGIEMVLSSTFVRKICPLVPIIYLSVCVHSFIQYLFISQWTHVYLFYTLGNTLMILYLTA